MGKAALEKMGDDGFIRRCAVGAPRNRAKGRGLALQRNQEYITHFPETGDLEAGSGYGGNVAGQKYSLRIASAMAHEGLAGRAR